MTRSIKHFLKNHVCRMDSDLHFCQRCAIGLKHLLCIEDSAEVDFLLEIELEPLAGIVAPTDCLAARLSSDLLPLYPGLRTKATSSGIL